MAQTFVDRNPTGNEVEALRLILSMYQDGTGQLLHPTIEGLTLPGWRDFERTVSLVFGGSAPKGKEGKNVFDVWIPDSSRQGVNIGLSCKMRGEWSYLQRTGRVTMELSNSAQQFWQRLNERGISVERYKSLPREVGTELINLVKEWHRAEDLLSGGSVDLGKSAYLSLMWSRKGQYQLHQFRLDLPNPSALTWRFPVNPRTSMLMAGLRGLDASGEKVFEWYGEAGGQLKYYPLAAEAIWRSPAFQLEPLPPSRGVYRRAVSYFPQLKSLLPLADGIHEKGE